MLTIMAIVSYAELSHVLQKSCTVPIAVVEPLDIVFVPAICTSNIIGRVNAVEVINASAVVVSIVNKRSPPGRPVSFALGVSVTRDSLGGEGRSSALVALARVVLARVTASATDKPTCNLPFTVEHSTGSQNSVDIVVNVPAGTPLGTRIVLHSVSVGGCEVHLSDTPFFVTVGYNHAPAPSGPVMAAAEAGDVPALMQELNNGGSTEEQNVVSASCEGHRCTSGYPESARVWVVAPGCDPHM